MTMAEPAKRAKTKHVFGFSSEPKDQEQTKYNHQLEDLLRQVLSVNHRHRELWDRLAVFRTDDPELADPKIEASILEIVTPQKPFHEAVPTLQFSGAAHEK